MHQYTGQLAVIHQSIGSIHAILS